MNEKICLITGANRGIGKAIMHQLATLGAMAVMLCRSQEAGEAARDEIIAQSGNPNVHLMVADLASQAAIRQFATAFKVTYPRLDVLVHNAGLVRRNRTITEDGIETTLAVNHLAPFLLTNLLLDRLQAAAPSRVIVTSSLVHKWGKIDFENLQGEQRYDMDKAYNQSKLANVLFTNELARRLADTAVTVNSYEPGMTVTDFGAEYTGFKAFMAKAWRPFMVTPEKAAETVVYLASSPEAATITGQHFVRQKAVTSAKSTYDLALAKKLWDVSAELVGIKTIWRNSDE